MTVVYHYRLYELTFKDVPSFCSKSYPGALDSSDLVGLLVDCNYFPQTIGNDTCVARFRNIGATQWSYESGYT